MEQSTVSESPLKDPMEQSRLSESPLKDSVDSKPPVVSKPPIVSKPPVVSKSPDPPAKKTHVKKLVFPLFIVLRDTGKDGMRNEDHEIPGCIEDPISGPRIKGPECFGDPLMHSN
ncbi:hypothetical protein TNCV_3006811 [Trichonephila clavipes]|nr:hypothetical protein TNCV_3006811 [Trichonephila clavipes]